MKLVIGMMDQRMRSFIQKSQFKERMMLINKMCNVKLIKEPVDIIIPFGIVLKSGIVSNTMVHLEELIITVDVKSIAYGNPANQDVMTYLADTYQIPTKHLKI